MVLLDTDGLDATGLPLYEGKQLFTQEGKLQKMSMSLITIPAGARIPEVGTSCHEEEEYSYFISGEVYSECGKEKGIVGKGMATLIHPGEEHWCKNVSDAPCTLLCVMVKKNEQE